MQKVKIEPFKVIGIAVRTTNENGKSAQDIGQLWGKFMSEGISDKIPNKINDTIFSIYTNYESDHTKPYDTILGCKVSFLTIFLMEWSDNRLMAEPMANLYRKET